MFTGALRHPFSPPVPLRQTTEPRVTAAEPSGVREDGGQIPILTVILDTGEIMRHVRNTVPDECLF